MSKRQLNVLDKALERTQYVSGDECSIADIAIWPWYDAVSLGRLYDAAEFLDIGSYKNVQRWTKLIEDRKEVFFILVCTLLKLTLVADSYYPLYSNQFYYKNV